MDIVELATYKRKLWHFMLICLVLGFMDVARVSVMALLLYSNIFHRKIGEVVSALYPREFFFQEIDYGDGLV